MSIFIINLILILLASLIAFYLYNQMMTSLFGLIALPFIEIFVVIICPIIGFFANIVWFFTTIYKIQSVCWSLFYLLIPTCYFLHEKITHHLYSSNYHKYTNEIKDIFEKECPNIELTTINFTDNELSVYVKSKVLIDMEYEDCKNIEELLNNNMNINKKIHVVSK